MPPPARPAPGRTLTTSSSSSDVKPRLTFRLLPGFPDVSTVSHCHHPPPYNETLTDAAASCPHLPNLSPVMQRAVTFPPELEGGGAVSLVFLVRSLGVCVAPGVCEG